MNELTEDERPLPPEEVWQRIRTALDEAGVTEASSASNIPALAGLFDILTIVERDFVAVQMVKALAECFNNRERLSSLHFSILAVVEPYINHSNYLTEARLQIASEFREFRSGARTFREYHAIGFALASLRYRAPGGSEEWKEFYEQYSGNEENRYDALDLALAATSSTDIGLFAELISRQDVETPLIRRLFSFLPTLVGCHAPRDVEQFLAQFLERVNDEEVRSDIVDLATQYGLVIRRGGSALVAMAPGSMIPAELQFAYGLIANEDQRGIQKEQLNTALERKSITVIHSGYSENTVIRSFQNEIIELIEELNGPADVSSMESSTFTQLPTEISGRRKVVFAFPTYLTAAKQDMGYSVYAFGVQRRLGVVYPSFGRLGARPNRTLSSLLTEVMRNNGQILCLQNYAISEIVRQAAERDPDLESYFNGSHLVLMPSIEGRISAIPLPRLPRHPIHNFVFIYDLAGQKAILERIKAQRKGRRGRDGWLFNATTEAVTHDLPIPVGIGFTKYLVKWLIEGDNWPRITALVNRWAEKSEFQRALAALGIDRDFVPTQPRSSITPALRVVRRNEP